MALPEGSEIPGLTEETDQMVVSVNAPRAVIEEEPMSEDTEETDGEETPSDGDTPETTDKDSSDEGESEES